jgi:hypothetical protein
MAGAHRQNSGRRGVRMFRGAGWFDCIYLSVLALACFIGAGIAYSNGIQPGRDLPPEIALKRAEGKLVWLRCKRRIVEFTLDSHPWGHFQYQSGDRSKSGVCESLKKIGDDHLAVAYAYDYYSRAERVYALDISGKSIVTYAGTAQKWHSKDEHGVVAGFLLALTGLFFLYRAFVAGKKKT